MPQCLRETSTAKTSAKQAECHTTHSLCGKQNLKRPPAALPPPQQKKNLQRGEQNLRTQKCPRPCLVCKASRTSGTLFRAPQDLPLEKKKNNNETDDQNSHKQPDELARPNVGRSAGKERPGNFQQASCVTPGTSGTVTGTGFQTCRVLSRRCLETNSDLNSSLQGPRLSTERSGVVFSFPPFLFLLHTYCSASFFCIQKQCARTQTPPGIPKVIKSLRGSDSQLCS